MGRVLIVDDEPDHRTTLAGILERAGVPTTAAADLVAALAVAQQDELDVAIVDLRLPGQDGLAAMHALRQAQSWVEIVILTAYPTPGTCRAALSDGAAAYLEKPFEPDALLALIETLRGRAAGRRAAAAGH
ncbi:MAG: response regulator [Fimbriimonadaceae bacterium]|nr:response regulator [Fimbriimonadaceae bacterium]